MVNVLQQVFGKSEPGPPCQININLTTSSTTLHKHGSSDPFTLTLEATLPKSHDGTPNRPLTILVFDTVLGTEGTALFENGLDFINSDTGTPAERSTLIPHYTFGDKSGILINTKFEQYFVTLEPGVPYRVTHTMRPCPRFPGENASKIAKSEAIAETVFSHAQGLDVGSTYQVALGNRMNSISWYRYGSKDEVLKGHIGGGLLQRLMGPKRHNEQVRDSEMPAIPLVLQNSAGFRVEE